MLVHDLQTFLSKFTEGAKKGTQGNALSHAKIFVERNGFLEEIKKMEVHESNIIGQVQALGPRSPNTYSMYKGSQIRQLDACGLELEACCLGLDACYLYLSELGT
jgi:hypothetical protein